MDYPVIVDEWAEFTARSACSARLSYYLLREHLDDDFLTYQVWPLARVLEKVRCGSDDWSWEEEWAWLDANDAEALARLEAEIGCEGMYRPLLIGNDGRLWDGHHRLRIAVRLGTAYVPVELTPATA